MALFNDDAKIQSWINNALIPMVQGLKGIPSVAGWEIFNEPEGGLNVGYDPEPCFDSTKLGPAGAGWNPGGKFLTMKQILKITNWASAAIHSIDPEALVTVGSWSELSQINSGGYKNFYTDECLLKAGGKNGKLDY